MAQKGRAQRMEKLGIIGGMGPAATARLLARVVEFTDAERDQDHVDVTVLNRPSVPDRTAHLLGKPDAPSFVPALVDMARLLDSLGCTVLAMPCNTAHARANEVRAQLVQARIVDMPCETAAFLRGLGCANVGVLATDGTLATGVYQQALAGEGLACIAPEDAVQRAVMGIIYDGVKAGRAVSAGDVLAVLDALVDAGCDGVVLGCTELSVVGAPTRHRGVPVVDALDVLAWRCVQECGAPARDLRI